MTADQQPPAACGDKVGTLTGLSRHRRAGEDTCRACRDAANRAQKARLAARKRRSYNIAHYFPGAP